MKSWLRIIKCSAAAFCTCAALAWGSRGADAQDFRYDNDSRPVGTDALRYSSPDPAPSLPSVTPLVEMTEAPRKRRSYLAPRYGKGNSAQRAGFDSISPGSGRRRKRDLLRVAAAEPIPAGQTDTPFYEEQPADGAPAEPLEGDQGGDEYFGPDAADAPHDVGLIGMAKRSWLFNPELWKDFNEFGGVQGFKGPLDRGVNGNFGFHKGVNWASPLWDEFGIGYQLGGEIAVSDFEGNSGPFNHTREQYFVTTGLFRRARCNYGWQGGAVFDFLQDNFYTSMSLGQMRGEISYQWCGHEFGIWAAAHVKSETKTGIPGFAQTSVTIQSTDQYNLYYRQRFDNGGFGRMWIGLSDHGDVLWGGDATAPLSERWAVQAAYNYLWPTNDPNTPRDVKESFGLQISLVWYPGYKIPNACFSPYRPLFTVAENSVFMVREHP